MKKNKRGLSPVIATVLLILVAVILAILIIIWIRSFFAEKVQKDVGGGPEPIDSFCSSVSFSADVYQKSSGDWKVSLENKGNIPVYGVEIERKGLASLRIVGEANSSTTVTAGDTQVLPVTISGSGISPGDSLTLVPKLLGQVNQQTKSYTCNSKFGLDVQAKSS